MKDYKLIAEKQKELIEYLIECIENGFDYKVQTEAVNEYQSEISQLESEPDIDLNTPFFGNSGAKIEKQSEPTEIKTADRDSNLRRILSDWYRRDDYSTESAIDDIYAQFASQSLQEITDEEIDIQSIQFDKIRKYMSSPTTAIYSFSEGAKWAINEIKSRL